MSKTDTLVNILRCGAELIQRRGFQATGLNDIMRSAGAAKGSFYYYFRSKDDFGLQLIDFHAGFLLARLEDHLDDGTLPPLERLRAFFREQAREMSGDGFSSGSLIGSLAQEMAGQSPAFREKLREVYEAMGAQVLACLADAAERGDIPSGLATPEVAGFILASWEGATLLARVHAGDAPLREFETFIFTGLLGAADADLTPEAGPLQ